MEHDMSEFRLIVAGGRDFRDRERLAATVVDVAESLPEGTQTSLVSGMARGADLLAYQFAVEANVKVYEFPADWNRYGKSAGYRRNAEMADFADGLLAFWDGQSRGTGHMINLMKTRYPSKPIWIENY